MNRALRSWVFAVLAAVPLSIAFGVRGYELTSPRADLTGTWTVTIWMQQGDFDMTWKLEQHNNNTLTGTVEGRQGSAEVEESWVVGNTFAFSMTRNFNGQEVVIEFEGELAEDDTLKGTLIAGGGQFTADFTGVRVAGGEE
jgi:hypothetical protein